MGEGTTTTMRQQRPNGIARVAKPIAAVCAGVCTGAALFFLAPELRLNNYGAPTLTEITKVTVHDGICAEEGSWGTCTN